MPIQDLDDIKTISGGSQKKKEAMFNSWIQELRRNGEKPTWQHILNVLTKLVIEKPIQDIKRRYRECVFCVHVLRGAEKGLTAAVMHAKCDTMHSMVYILYPLSYCRT